MNGLSKRIPVFDSYHDDICPALHYFSMLYQSCAKFSAYPVMGGRGGGERASDPRLLDLRF